MQFTMIYQIKSTKHKVQVKQVKLNRNFFFYFINRLSLSVFLTPSVYLCQALNSVFIDHLQFLCLFLPQFPN